MSSQTQSKPTQSNDKEIICTHCNKSNAAINAECSSCGKTLNSPNSENPATQPAEGGIGGLIVGAALVAGAAYGIWQAFNRSETESAPTPEPPRPPSRSNERVEGWVVGEIAIRTQPPVLLQRGGEVKSFKVNVMPSFNVGSIPIYPEPDVTYTKPVYSSPTAQFVFVLNQYPSGALKNWDSLPDHQLDILWHSEKLNDNRNSSSIIPDETPKLRAMVDSLVQTAMKDGWTSAGHGEYWFQYHLRKRYEQVGGPLKWK